MAYLPKTVGEIIEEINGKYFLPHIQRELVWKPPQITKLFDSLMRGYPISTFLFWKLAHNKDITKLEFIKYYDKGKSKNQINTDSDRDEYWLVLDGQQRLQSFYIALKGTYNGKELFFNALSKKVVNEEDDDESEIIYETRFFKRDKNNFIKEEVDKNTNEKTKKFWVKVKSFSLLKNDSIYDYIDNIKESFSKELSYEETKLLDKNLKKLNELITNTETIFYYLEQEEDYDKVLDIFVRTNSGGTKLSKSDLLFSMIKLKWKNIDAYSEFNKLIDEINNKGDFEFDNDFVLKTALVLIDADTKYRVENFNDKNISQIEDIWKEIKESVKTVIDLLIDFGITSKKMLPSKNSIIPLISYTYTNNIKTYASEKTMISDSKKSMKKWLYNTLLVNLFSSQTDEILKRCRKVIKEKASSPFPAKEINSNLPPGKTYEIKREEFDKITYGNNQAFYTLGLLYPKLNLNPISERNKPHIDHIFPKSMLESKYDDNLINNIGNLQLLTATENESKNKTSFDEWIKKRDKTFLTNNFIPERSQLWHIDSYTEFIRERRDILFNKLKKIFG